MVRRILLVEDDPQDLELALRALRNGGGSHRILVARDGEEALRILIAENPSSAADRPAVVVLDLKLPKLSGLEVLRRIRKTATTRNVPVVMLTSSQEERDVAESYALGANAYVVKPLDSAKFVQCVRALGTFWGEYCVPPP